MRQAHGHPRGAWQFNRRLIEHFRLRGIGLIERGCRNAERAAADLVLNPSLPIGRHRKRTEHGIGTPRVHVEAHALDGGMSFAQRGDERLLARELLAIDDELSP